MRVADSKLRTTTDYHVHTARCGHAGGSMRAFVEAAIARGLSEIAFTDHVPLYFLPGDDPDPGIAMTAAELPGYVEEVRALNTEFAGRIDHSRVYSSVGIHACSARDASLRSGVRRIRAPGGRSVTLGGQCLRIVQSPLRRLVRQVARVPEVPRSAYKWRRLLRPVLAEQQVTARG